MEEIFTVEEYQSILRQDFTSFIQRVFSELNPQTELLMHPYIEVIASKLEDCRQGKTKHLIINMPPRYLKSICASVAFPAFLLGHDPCAQIICASYGQDLSDKLARDCRTIINSSWYKATFPTRLAHDKKAINDFYTTKEGFRMATSVGGVLTGRGADFIIIDDPLKPDAAMSETARKSCKEWYDGTVLSRLNDKRNGCIIIIMQRLHQDDLIGHVLEKGDWEVLSFPAIAEEEKVYSFKNPFGEYTFTRSEGEVLHPERESLEMLASIRQTIGEYNFSSQYQQNPTPPGGAMVKTEWLRYDAIPYSPREFSTIIQSWDTANKATDLSDYSVCTIWGIKNKEFHLLHVHRKRMDYPDLKRAVKELAQHYKAAGTTTILIEDKASGTQLIQDLKADRIWGIEPYLPISGMDKVMRLHAQTAVFENGRVHFPADAPWLKEYLKELTSFPGAKYDDQVDSTTQALDYMVKTGCKLDQWRNLN